MADYEQLVLFDLAPYSSQQMPVRGKTLGLREKEQLKQIECRQLELDLFSKQSDEAPSESLRLAA